MEQCVFDAKLAYLAGLLDAIQRFSASEWLGVVGVAQ